VRRREFIVSAAIFAAATRHVSAQQPAKMKRLAMVNPTMKPADMRIGGDPTYTVIFEEMKRLGRVEGVNLIVDRNSAEGRFDRLPEIADEIVATRPDVIYTTGLPAAVKVFQSETRTIPIVAWTGDPISSGIISSLARPGGNVTGLSVQVGPEITGKRLQLFAEAVGKLSNVRTLGTPANWEDPNTVFLVGVAQKMRIRLAPQALQPPIDEAEYKRAFDAMQRDHVDAVMVSGEPVGPTGAAIPYSCHLLV
jgi:putative ABC transport system substrate-binding protein